MMWYGAGGWSMAVWMLLFWAGVILLLVWGARAASDGGRSRGGGTRSRALDILEERFARGEIDREEFEQRRSALRGR